MQLGRLNGDVDGVWRGVVVALSMISLSGCQAYEALTFRTAKGSGVIANQETRVAYISKALKPGDPLQLVIDDALRKVLPDRCVAPEPTGKEVPGLAIPLFAAGATLTFQFLTDQVATVVEGIRKRAQKTYGAKVTVDQAILTGTGSPECILVVRSTTNSPNDESARLGLAILFEKRVRGSGLTLTPTYIYLGNAVAETGSSKAAINISAAVVVRSLERPQGPNAADAVVRVIANQTFTVRGAKLGSTVIDCLSAQDCQRESAIFVPSSGDFAGATISVSVTETGSGFGDIDAALAEIKALRDALGPAIADATKTGLQSITD